MQTWGAGWEPAGGSAETRGGGENISASSPVIHIPLYGTKEREGGDEDEDDGWYLFYIPI